MKTIEKSGIQRTFSEELLSYRRAHHLSQSELARILNITDRSYISLEHGHFCPSVISFLTFMQLMTEEERSEFLNAILKGKNHD